MSRENGMAAGSEPAASEIDDSGAARRRSSIVQYNTGVDLCQNNSGQGVVISFLFPSDQAGTILARLARLEVQTGLPRGVIVQSLIMAADSQLIRVCAAGSPATAWRRRLRLDPLPIQFVCVEG